MRKSLVAFCLVLAAGLAAHAGEKNAPAAADAIEKAEKPLPSGELLSDHVAEAEFTGIIHRQCMFRTSLCPDKCDHRKPGKYGDEKQEKLMIDVNPAHRPMFQDASILKQVAALKPGDKVVLHWSHYYMHKDSSSFPERPVISIRPLPADGGGEP